MAKLKDSGVDLLALGEASKLGIKAPTTAIEQPEATVQAPTKAINPMEQKIRDIIGDDFEGVGSASTKAKVGLQFSQAEQSGARRLSGLQMIDESFEGLDKGEIIKQKLAGAKQVIANEKAQHVRLAAQKKAMIDDFKIREVEINNSLGQAISYTRQGRSEQAFKIIEDVVNPATINKGGIQYVVTGFDPESLKIDGFTQKVDVEGNKIGEAIPLQNETAQTLFQANDISGALGKAEALRIESEQKAQAEIAGKEVTLDREITQPEREITAGVRRPVQPTRDIGEDPIAKGVRSFVEADVQSALETVSASAESARGRSQFLEQAASIIDEAGSTGFLADAAIALNSVAKMAGLEGLDLTNEEDLKRLNAELIKPEVEVQGRGFTDADRRFFSEALVSSGKTKEGNRRALAAMFITDSLAKGAEEVARSATTSGQDPRSALSEYYTNTQGIGTTAVEILQRVEELEKGGKKIPFSNVLKLLRSEGII